MKASVKQLLTATREIKVRQKSMKAIKQPYASFKCKSCQVACRKFTSYFHVAVTLRT